MVYMSLKHFFTFIYVLKVVLFNFTRDTFFSFLNISEFIIHFMIKLGGTQCISSLLFVFIFYYADSFRLNVK